MNFATTGFRLAFPEALQPHVYDRLMKAMATAGVMVATGRRDDAALVLMAAERLPGGRMMVAAAFTTAVAATVGTSMQAVMLAKADDPDHIQSALLVHADGHVCGDVSPDDELNINAVRLMLATVHGGQTGFNQVWAQHPDLNSAAGLMAVVQFCAPVIITG